MYHKLRGMAWEAQFLHYVGSCIAVFQLWNGGVQVYRVFWGGPPLRFLMLLFAALVLVVKVAAHAQAGRVFSAR